MSDWWKLGRREWACMRGGRGERVTVGRAFVYRMWKDTGGQEMKIKLDKGKS